MTDAPERFPPIITAHIDRLPKAEGEVTGTWVDHGPPDEDERYYTLRTPEALAADPLVQEMIAEAEERAVSDMADMHERAWARECDRGNLDKAAWHQECAQHIAALKEARE